MWKARRFVGADHGTGTWSALLVLLAALLVPTACVLWFMNEAVRNERMAVRQKLAEVYRQDLENCQKRIDGYFQDVLTAMDSASGKPPAEAFAELVGSGQVGAALIYRNGKLSYPTVPETTPADKPPVAPDEANPPDAALRAIEVLPTADPQRARLAAALAARLRDYAGPAMASPHRVFLMRELAGMSGERFATLAGEELALQVLEESESIRPPAVPEHGPLLARASGASDLWMLVSARGDVVGMWSERQVTQMLSDMTRQQRPAGARLEFREAASAWDMKDAFLAVPAGRYAPRWFIALSLDGADPFALAARRQETAYLWTGGVGIAAIAVLGIAMAAYLRRQMRLTRLKNDLTATVSHELKTPLSSMRVLVDTLVEGRCRTREQEKEYLGLIARENMRLSRLIDNFLTFSRMERNKRTFEFRRLEMAEVAHAAVEAMGERACAVRLELVEGLPAVNADRDAMVTVIVNLLDNAWKYSGEPRKIELRAFADADDVCVAVKDHGVGIARRHQRRIFERFYQVDQSLSRTAGGCGLGLSIVRFIVEAHGGQVKLESQAGVGSTFTVRLPRAERAMSKAGVDHGH